MNSLESRMAASDGSPELVERLQAGETIQFRPVGNSMRPRIKSRQLVTVEPCDLESVEKGDVVYAKVGRRLVLHLCSAVAKGRVQISNNHGFVNGWTSTVYGKVTKVED
jgi:hypothetical protein